MARFQSIERPKETVCNLIQKSMQKIKNKKGRVEGRRSKGVQTGLLREVLVKGVVTNLVKVANKEIRFPKEISRNNNKNNRTSSPGRLSPSPRLRSPSKSPTPKRWQSPPATTKRNLLKQELRSIKEKIENLSPKKSSPASPQSSPGRSPSASPLRTLTPNASTSPKKNSPSVATFKCANSSAAKSPLRRDGPQSNLKRKSALTSIGSPATKRLRTSAGSIGQTQLKAKPSASSKANSAPRRKIQAIRKLAIERQRSKAVGLSSGARRTHVAKAVKRKRRKLE